MSKGFVITLEIMIIIWAPLGILYARGRWSKWWMVVNLPILYAVWFLTNSPVHEFSHAAGVYAAGGTVTETRLLTRFWKGEWDVAWIHAQGIFAAWQQLVVATSPYVLDAVSIACGLLVLRRKFFRSSFLTGLLLVVLVLRPLFNVASNATGLVLERVGDLAGIEVLTGSRGVGYVFAALLIAFGVYAVGRVLTMYKAFPAMQPLPAVPSEASRQF